MSELFPLSRPEPEAIVADALKRDPIAIFAGYSGGDDSLALVHWMMTNVPGCRVLHINTGIGIERTRQHVRETCVRFGWPLLEVRAEDDCGESYEREVLKYGFPGPPQHGKFYNRLKGRAIEKVLRDEKAALQRRKGWRNAKVMFATGIRYDESARRMRYADCEINFVGSQMWVSPLYWWPQSRFMDYIREHDLPRSPISKLLGMSGECLCGAFASRGELAMVRLADPATADRIEALQARVRAAGFDWGWEEGPPRKDEEEDPRVAHLPGFEPLCRGCGKGWEFRP